MTRPLPTPATASASPARTARKLAEVTSRPLADIQTFKRSNVDDWIHACGRGEWVRGGGRVAGGCVWEGGGSRAEGGNALLGRRRAASLSPGARVPCMCEVRDGAKGVVGRLCALGREREAGMAWQASPRPRTDSRAREAQGQGWLGLGRMGHRARPPPKQTRTLRHPLEQVAPSTYAVCQCHPRSFAPSNCRDPS